MLHRADRTRQEVKRRKSMVYWANFQTQTTKTGKINITQARQQILKHLTPQRYACGNPASTCQGELQMSVNASFQMILSTSRENLFPGSPLNNHATFRVVAWSATLYKQNEDKTAETTF